MRQLSRIVILNYISNYIGQNLKNQSHKILRLWGDQCEYILAHRFRRGQQILCHYSKLWEERALKELLLRFRKQVQRNARIIIFGSIGFFLLDWDKEFVYCEALNTHYNEIDYVKRLKKDTIICPLCNRRKIIDYKIEGIDYCCCSKEKLKQYEIQNQSNTVNTINHNNIDTPEWTPYLERENIIIWRREEKPGLYSYKVYAHYDDITAEDFLYVQTDIEYRKKWDKTAVTLDVVESNDTGKTQIIYWEMLWPKLFANRDYVYNRRYYVDRQRKIIVITNKSAIHPKCPVKPQNQRVLDYWSYMVIKPTTTFKKPGLEYVLTYFDNPGVVMPPAVTSWVAQRQMPDFLKRLYCATLDYASTKPNENEIYAVWDSLRDPGYEYPPEPEANFNKNNDDDDDNNNNNDDNSSKKSGDIHNKMTKSILNDPELQEDDTAEENDNNNVTRKTSWWHYLHPYYYFA